jgi:hypothetical protein
LAYNKDFGCRFQRRTIEFAGLILKDAEANYLIRQVNGVFLGIFPGYTHQYHQTTAYFADDPTADTY